MLHIISMFTFPSDPSSFLFWRFISSTSQKLWFSPYAFKALFIFTKWKYTFFKRFHVYKMAKTRFPSGFVLQNEKTSFRSIFHVCKRKNMFLKNFSYVKNETYVLDYLYKIKMHVFKAFFMFANEKTRFRSISNLYKMKSTFSKHFSCSLQNENTFLKRFFCVQNKNHVFE